MSTRTLTTAIEFERIAAGLGPCELVRGEVITLSPGGLSHSRVTARIAGLLWEWERRTRLGRTLTGEVGFAVETQPDTVRGADVAYYAYERLPKQTRLDGFSAVPPNLVVEIVGKGQGWREMVEKVGEYLRMGVDRVWVIDPKSCRVHVYSRDAEPSVLARGDTLTDETVLPGFSCQVDEFFAD
ncbi:MAG: Uma2 family endonuclease [Planctomycetes bacterium]|nr:Uma2 family endonuclease [Planctomycetota bacterium]